MKQIARTSAAVATLGAASLVLTSCIADLTGSTFDDEDTGIVGIFGTVESIENGETLVVDVGDRTETVVLQNVHGISDDESVEFLGCLADDATEFVSSKVEVGDMVAVAGDSSERDLDGNIVAGVYVGGELLNAELARAGLGVPESDQARGEFEEKVSSAFDEAAESQRGLFDPDVACTIPYRAENAMSEKDAFISLVEIEGLAYSEEWAETLKDHPEMEDSMLRLSDRAEWTWD